MPMRLKSRMTATLIGGNPRVAAPASSTVDANDPK